MILITGAGGAVGSALLDELRAAGRPARAGYRTAAKAERARAAGQEAVALDLGDPASLPPALHGVDEVFLLGAMGPHQTRHELTMVEAAAAAGVRRVVKLSVWRADEELTPIARLHHPVERALESSGLAWTFLRPNFYMQNFSRQMAASIRADGEFAQLAATAPISFVDVRDVARCAAVVFAGSESGVHDGRTYALTGPAALTYDEAAAVLSDELGRTIRYVGMSDDDARHMFLDRGLPEFHADSLVEVGRAYRDGGADTVLTTVRDLTGRHPTGFGAFVRDHRDAFGRRAGLRRSSHGGAP
ncbi:NmrA family NAD(P)-binding protein [Actinomadura verrucosospora]|uniref:FMN-dependent NADH-azoreductase n=1 Tax=Actinomadura verrucosospora TaxID=46165 RepID=A0A7D3VSL1_ACTVE|nr:NmrA family NAD(P)-binding protein [Actinomadura verrucosospora]QKG21570.1 FMN-dependent NADH-azoreductase [Actinomadura verrucosospora]